mmetsp:Transcript_20204/g.68431  ORF Transcript_20204/g.68431 Transcript_20204/m.68431 type:complete len:229 (-) Transcript_20204:151-837(-)
MQINVHACEVPRRRHALPQSADGVRHVRQPAVVRLQEQLHDLVPRRVDGPLFPRGGLPLRSEQGEHVLVRGEKIAQHAHCSSHLGVKVREGAVKGREAVQPFAAVRVVIKVVADLAERRVHDGLVELTSPRIRRAEFSQDAFQNSQLKGQVLVLDVDVRALHRAAVRGRQSRHDALADAPNSAPHAQPVRVEEEGLVGRDDGLHGAELYQYGAVARQDARRAARLREP